MIIILRRERFFFNSYFKHHNILYNFQIITTRLILAKLYRRGLYDIIIFEFTVCRMRQMINNKIIFVSFRSHSLYLYNIPNSNEIHGRRNSNILLFYYFVSILFPYYSPPSYRYIFFLRFFSHLIFMFSPPYPGHISKNNISVMPRASSHLAR